MPAARKQLYPAFLREFKGKSFDHETLKAAFYASRVGGRVRGEIGVDEFFSEFRVDETHWVYHQRILQDDVLFRLISEGYLHPTTHPVAAIYYDHDYYRFVFPFIHTAITHRMATVISAGNSEAMKLLMQWIEPFGDYFLNSFYKLVIYRAEQILQELKSLTYQRKILPFNVYSQINPALMHLLNRLPDSSQRTRDDFALEVLQFATWLRNDMKVYTQPAGMLTRLKLLNTSPGIQAQVAIQLRAWDKEQAETTKEKFNLNHLIWIVPLVFILAFIIFRNTEFGRSSEDIIAEQEMTVLAEQEAENELWNKINLRMESIDLNQLIAEELFVAEPLDITSGVPVEAEKDPGRLDNGSEPYKDWLKPGRKIYPMYDITLELSNQSSCDMVVFLRQSKPPYMERAYYIKAGKGLTVYDDGQRNYYLRVYAGTGWVDTLVTGNYDQKLVNAGVPEEVYDQFPATTELRGRFMYQVESIEENLQPVNSADVKSNMVTPDDVPIVIIEGDRQMIRYQPKN